MDKRVIALALGLAAALTLTVVATAKGPGGASFTNFELGPTGSTCPGSSSCWNFAAEPPIRADGAGRFFASSENGLGGGTDAWRSTDNGLHYTGLASPNAVSGTDQTGFAPGGGDTDLAVAPEKNAAGLYNVYVASLSLANVDVSTSTDGGNTWKLNPVTTPETLDDREWIAADGAAKVCISYHDAPQGITVGCSQNAGTTFTQFSSAIDAAHAWQISNNAIGNLAIDPASHIVYQTYSSIASAAEAPVGEVTAPYHSVWMAVSTNGGLTFTDYPVYVNPDANVTYGHQFVNVSVDRAGNVYSVYTDNHNVSYSFSTDHGNTWHGPYQISKGGTAIFPWSTAGDAGKVDVVYYKTPYSSSSTTPDNYPMSAAWTVGFAQNSSATTPGSSWSEQTASPIVHYGGVCESGVACTGNRDLYDDFGVAVSPTTGLASIVYSDDQYTSDANDPPQPGCTQASSNTGRCDHTAIATQTSGTGIYSTRKH